MRDQFESRYAMTEAGNEREDSGDQQYSDDAAFVLDYLRSHDAQTTENMFDSLPSLGPLRRSTAVMDELRLFLNMDPEHVPNPVQWWYENRATYPRLYRMALDYLTIPGKYSICGDRALPCSYLRKCFLMQRPPLTSNGCSVVGTMSFHSRGANCQLPRRGRCYALDHGVFRVWFGTKMSKRS